MFFDICNVQTRYSHYYSTRKACLSNKLNSRHYSRHAGDVLLLMPGLLGDYSSLQEYLIHYELYNENADLLVFSHTAMRVNLKHLLSF